MFNYLHHIGIVVSDINAATNFYEKVIGLTKTHREIVKDQAIEAILLNASNCEIELLAPIDAVSGVAKYLEKFGNKFHHLCFAVDDVQEELNRMSALSMELIDFEPRKGLVGDVGFAHPKSTNDVLVEVAAPEQKSNVGNSVKFKEVLLANNNNAIISNWNNFIANDLELLNPKIRFMNINKNDDKISNVTLTMEFDSLELLTEHLNTSKINFVRGSEYYPNQSNAILIDSKNSFGLDIICLEF
jgi:methylmalonyl-CoA/ethylmalonyl-CoA epimerase